MKRHLPKKTRTRKAGHRSVLTDQEAVHGTVMEGQCQAVTGEDGEGACVSESFLTREALLRDIGEALHGNARLSALRDRHARDADTPHNSPSSAGPQKDIPLSVRKGSAAVAERVAGLSAIQRYAVLATTMNDQPHTSLVAFALAPSGEGIVFATPKQTLKYRSILANRRVSFLIDSRTNSEKDYLAAESIAVTGTARPVRRGRLRESLADALKARHPALSAFIDADTTALVMIEPTHYTHVGTFQTVTHARSGRRGIRESR